VLARIYCNSGICASVAAVCSLSYRLIFRYSLYSWTVDRKPRYLSHNSGCITDWSRGKFEVTSRKTKIIPSSFFSSPCPEPKSCSGKLVMGLLILVQKDANLWSLVTDKNKRSYTYTVPIRHYVVATTSCLSSVADGYYTRQMFLNSSSSFSYRT
jgi:hypothetical protein